MEPKRALTALRGLAAWWVVVFHFREALPASTPEILRQLAAAGYLAVDLFFILSGYVIALNYTAWFAGAGMGRARYFRFLALRLSRIYPLHAVILLIFPLLPLATALFSSRHETGGLYLGYYLQSVFLIQGWGFFRQLHWNVPAWSISTEWLAYLAFPGLAVVGARLCRTAGRSLAVIVGLLFGLACLAAYVSRGGLSDAASVFAPLRCLAEFSCGIGLYHYGRHGRRLAKGTLALVSAGTCFLSGWAFGLPDYFLVPAGFVALIHGLADERGRLAAWLRWAPLQWLGVVSYSTYMCHYFLKTCIKLALVRPGVPEGAALAAYLLAVLAASGALHYAVERPGQRLLRGRFLNRRK